MAYADLICVFGDGILPFIEKLYSVATQLCNHLIVCLYWHIYSLTLFAHMPRIICLIAALIFCTVCALPQDADHMRFTTLVDSAHRAMDANAFSDANALLEEAAKLPFDGFPDSIKYNYYHTAALNGFMSGKLVEAEEMESIALAIATSMRDSAKMLLSNASLANTKSVQGRTFESLQHHSTALRLSVSHEDSTQYYRILNNLSHAYKSAGKLDSALYVLIRAKKYYSRIGSIYEQGVIEGNIAEIYREDFKDFDLARKHYLNALRLHKISDHQGDLNRVYHNYAILLTTLEQLDSAKYYLNMSTENRRKMGDVSGIASSLVELGRVYLAEDNYGSAVSNFAEALRICKKYGIQIGIYHSSLLLAEAHAKMGNYRVALANYEAALDAAKENRMAEELAEANRQMYKLHKDAGMWQAALASLEQYEQVQSEIDSSRRDMALAEIKSRYETELTENENAALLLEKELTAEQLAAQRWLVWGLSLVLVLFLLIGFFLFRAIKQRDSALSDVEQARENLEEKLEEISLQEKRLLEANEFKNRVISVIGHDLRAPLANIVGILSLIKDSDASPAEMNDMFEHLRRETDTNLKSLQNLLEWARLEEEGLKPKRKEFDPRAIVDEALGLHDGAIKEKNLKVEIGGHGEIWADMNQFKSVVSNLLGNAIKYSPEGGKVKVHTKDTAPGYLFSVSDQGSGMPVEVIEALKSRERIKSRRGTHGERGTGLGLRLVHDFALAHGGELNIVNNRGGGTTAEVFFPKPHTLDSAELSAEASVR